MRTGRDGRVGGIKETGPASEAAVIGVPDPLKGEAIVAFRVLKEAASMDDLAAHLKTLGPTFRPHAIEAVPEMPKRRVAK